MKNKIINNRKRVIRGERNEPTCPCSSIENNFEDFTDSILGQELTRRIEIGTCLDCGEKFYDAKPLIEMEAEMKAKVISLANERLKVPRSSQRRSSLIRQVPEGHTNLRYYDDVDLLDILFSNHKSVSTEADEFEGLIYDFDEDDNLVCIEIINFYGKYVTNEADDQN